MFRVLKRLIAIVRSEGVGILLRTIRHHISERYHEWHLGIISRGIVKVLGVHNETTCFGYEPIDYLSSRKVFKNLVIRADKDVFIDYGSGMGRAVIIAATYPFQRVIGVEISAELNSVAQENVRRARSKLKCKDVQLIAIDAREYALPPDVTVVYSFSSFGEEIISKVIGNIRKSLSEAPRKLTIVYGNPRIFEKVIQDCHWLIKRREFRRWDGIRFVVYECNPMALGLPDVP